jgi:hypothetical protein
MSNDTRYNGWTNYATWRINLEIFDGATLEDMCGTPKTAKETDDFDAYAIGQQLKDYVHEILEGTVKSLALDYAIAFVSNVNWYEIAEHLIEAHIDAQNYEA